MGPVPAPEQSVLIPPLCWSSLPGRTSLLSDKKLYICRKFVGCIGILQPPQRCHVLFLFFPFLFNFFLLTLFILLLLLGPVYLPKVCSLRSKPFFLRQRLLGVLPCEGRLEGPSSVLGRNMTKQHMQRERAWRLPFIHSLSTETGELLSQLREENVFQQEESTVPSSR